VGIIRAIDAEICWVRTKCECLSETWQSFSLTSTCAGRAAKLAWNYSTAKPDFSRWSTCWRSGGGVGVLSDQHAGDHGLWTPFFGRLASTSPLPGLLAKRTRAALIAAGVYTTGPARWRMVFTERFDQPGTSVADITSRINEVIEKQIRVAPDDWFWVHNRWKTPQPNFLLARYKRGVHLAPGISARDLKPFRILIRSSNWLGDAVMSVPAVRAIKNARPDAHITIAAPEKIAPVWRLFLKWMRLFRCATVRFFELCLCLNDNRRSMLRFSFQIRCGLRLNRGWAGFHAGSAIRGHWRSWLLNQTVRESRKAAVPPEHHSLRFLRIARRMRKRKTSKSESFPERAFQQPVSNVKLQLRTNG